MNRQLRNKIIYFKGQNGDYFLKDDVKQAYEWAMKELDKNKSKTFKSLNDEFISMGTVKRVLMEAFEDVKG